MIFRTICFEIPADDVERAKKFYSDLFGWKMEKWPGADGKDSSSSNMEYWIVSTTDDKGNKASIGGGMMKRQDSHQQITNFIDVSSVDEYSS
ncbi:MAG: VOC family protein, partial [Nitrososphaeraceae archaeon]